MMESNNNNKQVSRGEDDNASNISYASNNEDDQILTATITFDVTVDPNGQVISATEGQIISETSGDGRRMSLADAEKLTAAALVGEPADSQNTPMQDDSLTNINSKRHSKDLTGLHDSLDEQESDSDDSTSTSTESLIERSKKYMNQEAGIIILKRDNPATKNFNINLDFDLKNENQDGSQENADSADPSKNFNINLDFDVQNPKRTASTLEDNPENPKDKGFNINLDFDIKNNQNRPSCPPNNRKTGVDIDLLITSSTTTSKIERLEENINEETIEEILHKVAESKENEKPRCGQPPARYVPCTDKNINLSKGRKKISSRLTNNKFTFFFSNTSNFV